MSSLSISDILAWRWAPCVGLVLGSLSFVGFAVALIPDHLGEPAAAGVVRPSESPATTGESPAATGEAVAPAQAPVPNERRTRHGRRFPMPNSPDIADERGPESPAAPPPVAAPPEPAAAPSDPAQE